MLSKKPMSLTRRSFVKKSSYSAAAVTALCTGIGLSEVSSPIGGATYTVRTVVYKQFNIVEFKTQTAGLTASEALEAAIQELSVLPDNGITIPGPTGGSTSTKTSEGPCNQTGPWVITGTQAGSPPPSILSNGASSVNGVTIYSWSITFNTDYTITVSNFKS